jgi:hypothetical protein
MVLKRGFDPRLGNPGENNARYHFNYFIDFAAHRSASTLALQCWMGLCTIRCYDFNPYHYRHFIAAWQDIIAEA